MSHIYLAGSMYTDPTYSMANRKKGVRTTRNYVHGHRYGGTQTHTQRKKKQKTNHSENTLNALHEICENEDEEL